MPSFYPYDGQPNVSAGPAVTATDDPTVNGGVFPPFSLAWASTGRTLLVTTYGSGSCPQVVERKIVSTVAQRIALQTTDPHNPGGVQESCTADLTGTTSAVEIPPDIDPGKPLTVEINDQSLVLPARR